MNVVFAIKGLHRAAGGAERVIVDVSAEMARRGHKVTLLSFDESGASPFYDVDPAVELIGLGVGDPLARSGIRDFLARIGVLRRVLRKRRPDVVVAFMHSMFIPMAFALAGTGIPVVASEHIVRAHYRRRLGQYALYFMAVPFVRTITVLSVRLARHYPWWIRRKMVPVSNPIAASFLKTAAGSGNDSSGGASRRVLSIGRFDEQKDHGTLIKAFASLGEAFKDWQLRLVGDGPQRTILNERVERLGLRGRVFLPGTTKDVGGEFAKATFFALASNYESFGLVVAEAMACGKAVVAFAECPGVNELIEHEKTGLLVHGDDRVKAMAEGMRRLMTDENLRLSLGRQARQHIAGRFSLESIGNRWEKIIRKAAP
jgi:glycosyltransferase involved in cell wall biosynthesis